MIPSGCWEQQQLVAICCGRQSQPGDRPPGALRWERKKREPPAPGQAGLTAQGGGPGGSLQGGRVWTRCNLNPDSPTLLI